MDLRRFQRVSELFDAARQHAPVERATFLDQACRDDPELRAEVESLLKHHEQPGHTLDDSPLGTTVDLSGILDAGADSDVRLACVGRYRLLDKLGEGGMGEVYLAEQTEPVRRVVALKIIKLGMSSKQVIARFEAERQALAMMDHPNVAKVFDAGESEDGRPYFVMDRIDGLSITTYCHETGLTLRERLRLFVPVCGAIEHAHQKGVIHRDIKPSNVLVCERNGQAVPVVIDFGVAKAIRESLTEKTILTLHEQLIGTPQYMSPEQARLSGDAVDTRSDIYSLGVLLYEMLTGSSPYRAGSLQETLQSIHADEPIRPSHVTKQVDDEVETILLKCLSKEPVKRYQSAGELARDIERYLDGEPIEAKRESGWYVLRKQLRRHRLPLGICAAFVLLITGSSVIAWILYSWADRESKQATERLWESCLERSRALCTSNRVGRRFSSLGALAEAAAIRTSVELRNAAIAALTLSDVQLLKSFPGYDWTGAAGLGSLDRFARSRRLGEVEIVSIADGRVLERFAGPPLEVRVLLFSPDGRYLGVKYHSPAEARARFWVWDLQRAQKALDVEPKLSGTPIAFDPLSQWVAIAGSDKVLRLYHLPSGDEWKSLVSEPSPYRICPHPAGQKLAISSEEQPRLQIWDLSTERVEATVEVSTRIHGLAWSPDGRFLAGAGGDYRIYVWDGGRGAPVTVLSGHQGQAIELYYHPCGAFLASWGWDGTTRFWDLKTHAELLGPLIGWRINGFGQRFAGYSRTMDFGLWQFEPGCELRIFDTDANFGSGVSLCVWPDGRLLATAGLNGLRLWDLSTGEELVTLRESRTWTIVLRSDGEMLLALSEEGLWRWFLRKVGDTVQVEPPVLLWSKPGMTHACFTPDEQGVVLKHNKLTFFDLDAARPLRTLPGYPGLGEKPSMTRDGRWMVTGSWRGKGAKVWDLRTEEVVEEFPGDSVLGAFSPDDRWLVISRATEFLLVESATWRIRHRIAADVNPAGAVAFMPEGNVAALATSLSEIQLVELESGESLATLASPGLKATVSLTFGPDGSILVVGTADRELEVWDLRRIRAHLQELGLDWNTPPYPPATVDPAVPLKVEQLR